MAPVGEAYFPTLNRCFNGSSQLWSWEQCYCILSQTDSTNALESLRHFLSDERTSEILANPLAPYPQPNATSKSSFESRTSAIHVSPISDEHCNITKIKEDSLWLSEKAKVDEVSALRVVVLDWQAQSRRRLISSVTDQGVSEDSGNRFANGPPFPSKPLDGQHIEEESDATGQQRKQRILRLFLRECTFILKTSEYILSDALCYSDISGQNAAIDSSDQLSWVVRFGNQLYSRWAPQKTSRENTQSFDFPFVIHTVEGIRIRLESLAGAFPWPDVDATEGAGIEDEWAKCKIVEIAHALQILQALLQHIPLVASASVALSWFRLMAECGHFEGQISAFPIVQDVADVFLQPLSSLISLTLLNITATLDLLLNPSTANLSSTSTTEKLPYALHPQTVNELNDTFISMASSAASSPAMLAWSIITQTIRDVALSSREMRETRQSIRAVDKYGFLESSDNESVDKPVIRPMSGMRRRSSTGSDSSQQSILLEEVYDAIQITGLDEDSIAYLARHSVERGKVFQVIASVSNEYCRLHAFEHHGINGRRMRRCFLDLILAALNYIEYQPALMLATLAAINGAESYWDLYDAPQKTLEDGPATLLRTNEGLKRKIFLNALYRFPYETIPLLQVCRALSYQESKGQPAAIWSDLRELDSFCCLLPTSFQGYRNIREDEESDFIELTEDYRFSVDSTRLADVGSRSPKDKTSQHVLVQLSRAIQGQVISNGKPLVVAWNYEYSGLAYLGRILQYASSRGSQIDSSYGSLSVSLVSESIELVSFMLMSAAKRHDEHDDAIQRRDAVASVLGQAGSGLDKTQDVISVIFEVFENQLYLADRPPENQDMEILVRCVQFTHSLLAVMPERVWPFLGRSGLLGVGKESSRLSSIVAAYEVPLGHFDFLLGCLKLFDSCIEDVVRRAVLRSLPPKTMVRFDDGEGSGTGVSNLIIEKVILSFETIMISILENVNSWKFSNPLEEAEIGTLLCSTTAKLLRYTYAPGIGHVLRTRLTSPLVSAATYVLDSTFANQGSSWMPVLSRLCYQGLAHDQTSLPSRGTGKILSRTLASLDLLTTLIETLLALNKDISGFKTSLVAVSPLLTGLYASNLIYREPIIKLLTLLISAKTSEEALSLQASLGRSRSIDFVKLLSLFDQPSNDEKLAIRIWNMFTALVTSQQDWFSQVLISGLPPRGPSKLGSGTDGLEIDSQSVFNKAVRAVSNIDRSSSRLTTAILQYVATSLDLWPQCWRLAEKDPKTFESVTSYLMKLSFKSPRKLVDDPNASYEVMSAYYCANIEAIHIRRSSGEGQNTAANDLLEQMRDWSPRQMVVPTFNLSLHGNLRRNFSSKFPGSEVDEFQSRSLASSPSWDCSAYNISLASKMLSFDPSWQGFKGHGFAEEFQRANQNLSVVRAQKNLFEGWKFLLLELASPLQAQAKYVSLSEQTITACLNANADDSLPSIVGSDMAPHRAELAFALLESVNRTDRPESNQLEVLSTAWHALRSYSVDIGTALVAMDSNYYRLLLKILALAIQTHSGAEDRPSERVLEQNRQKSSAPAGWGSTKISLEIISSLIAPGFRALARLLHDSPEHVCPYDFVLLTTIFRLCLRVPYVDRHSSRLVDAFAASQTSRSAAVLLSWSHQLASDTEGDPVYAELAMAFLLDVSSVPALAEHLAVEGILPYILSTNVIHTLQNKAFGAFDAPQRMFLIWSRGLLPLLLNLTFSIGTSIAVEISAALNSFSHQLERANLVMGTAPRRGRQLKDLQSEYITLSMAQEAHCLAMLSKIMSTYRQAGASAAVDLSKLEELRWDAAQVREDADGWLQRRAALRERIVPTNEKEDAWSKMKPSKPGLADNKLEEKIRAELRGVVTVLGNEQDGGD